MTTIGYIVIGFLILFFAVACVEPLIREDGTSNDKD